MPDLYPDHRGAEVEVRIPVQSAKNRAVVSAVLDGKIAIPDNLDISNGIVIFAHERSSGRDSSINIHFARALNDDGLATLLVDLLSKEEGETDIRTQRMQTKLPDLILNKFNISLLSERLIAITDWLLATSFFKMHKFTMGYFGASTGAAAALIAAAERTNLIAALVCRSGRTDLVSDKDLVKVKVPTLFVVGDKDAEVMEFNSSTLSRLCNVKKKKLKVFPGTSHLLEKRGTFEELVKLASGWFRCYFLIAQHGST